MSIEILLYMLVGFLGGAVGGYLGLGGGIIMVPLLTIVLGIPIKSAVPISVTAIVVNSIAASTEYLKKGMVDFEIAVIFALFMVTGSIIGSSMSSLIPEIYVRTLFSAILVYSAISFLKSRSHKERSQLSEMRKRYLILSALLVFMAGILAGLLGIGGGVVLVPLIYLAIGLPLTVSRGTTSFLTGFSAAAAMMVYLLQDKIDIEIAPAVILGVIVGGKTGGYLGTLAKPMVVKIIFFCVMILLAFKLAIEPLL